MSEAAPIVIKIGGASLEHQRESGGLWRAIWQAHARAGVVLVHGGGKAVDTLLGRLNMPTERREGLRITPPEQMDVIAGVLAGTMNKLLVGALNRERSGDAIATGLCLGDGLIARASKITGLGFDPGRVGTIDHTPGSKLLSSLLREKYLPVVSSIGIDDAGDLLNINADDAAAGLALGLRASALVLLTDVEGVRGEDGAIEHVVSQERVKELIRTGVASGGMGVKLRAAAEVARKLGSPVTILSGKEVRFLEQWSRGEPTGTRVQPD